MISGEVGERQAQKKGESMPKGKRREKGVASFSWSHISHTSHCTVSHHSTVETLRKKDPQEKWS